MTISSFVLALAIGSVMLLTQPLGMRASPLSWEAFFPLTSEPPALSALSSPSPNSEERWTVMPFFYSLGAWPKAFHNKPVFYQLPYEKGPPTRFAGAITARWDPQVRMIFEGPKSPVSPQKTLYRREEIKECIVGMWKNISHLPHCLAVRSAVLGRHLDALHSLHPTFWQLQWVQVNNHALGALGNDELLQGIYLSARSDRHAQDRFILITAQGTHQTLMLDYPVNELGNQARAVFQNALRSLRVSDELGPGRTWVDDSLEKVNLKDIAQLGEDPSAIERLAEIEALLIARISVDPKTYDTYFHLAGTALLLGQRAVRLRQLAPPQGNPELATEILITAKPLVQSAQKYALDINPKDPRNPLLQSFLAESQKF